MTVASNRLNAIVNLLGGCQSYLEVGVDKGTTFIDVKSELRSAVDPRFKFNPSEPEFSLDCNRYFEITSDQYFRELDVSQMFDLVFLDGLHEYEQTYRDFNNALAHLNPGGVIVIDDTMPFDVFSAHRSNAKTIQLRSEFADARPGWNGDVFKAMVLIAAFHPGIDFCSLGAKGVKSQSFLWRRGATTACKGRPDPSTFQAMVHNMESAHYLWLLENIVVLNRVETMDEVLDLMRSSR